MLKRRRESIEKDEEGGTRKLTHNERYIRGERAGKRHKEKRQLDTQIVLM
jgi:hypothetical protein